ncbi:TrkH-domain-containing protein, partial [Teratosphaeria nubilosa]
HDKARLNFYRTHLAYFIGTIIITSLVMWGANTRDGYQLRYIDALFTVGSVMTTTGLNAVDYNVFTGYQQSILLCLLLLGDLSIVSLSVVFTRRWLFRRRICLELDKHPGARNLVQEIDEERAQRAHHHGSPVAVFRRRARGRDEHAAAKIGPVARRRSQRTRHRGLGAPSAPWETDTWRRYFPRPWRWLDEQGLAPEHHHYLSFSPQLDQRGRFRQLSAEEYDELGGVEYRALKLLCWLLPLHTAFFILVPTLILATYASQYGPVATLISTSQPGNLNPGWWGVFNAVSSYTNCGYSLLNSSMILFQSNWLILIVTGAGIIAGNTFYPIFLRMYVYMLWKVAPESSSLHHSLTSLLHHPRRCYLWLFDKRTTWILTFTQLGLILGEWVLFEILNIHQTAISALPAGTRTMDGLYQSLGTRSVGYYIVNISSIAPAMQIIYCVVMYLSVFPILVSLRTTNVYEERSLGLDAEQYEASTRGTHVRNQLAYDLWWIALAWILICIIEEPQLNVDAPGFDIFSILFEVVSGYGNCGLSLGVPYASYSLCGQFHTLSKLVSIPVMLRGRHRILPLAIDRSILLPGQGLMEEMDRELNPTIAKETTAAVREAERGGREQDAREAASERNA